MKDKKNEEKDKIKSFIENKNVESKKEANKEENKFKCFVHKTNQDKMKLVFYNYGGVKKFKVKTTDFYEEFDKREWDEISLPFINCDSLIVECEDEVFDLTEEINKIGYNEFTKYD